MVQIWVTSFSWDGNAINSPKDQMTWLRQAYLMMRAQLYLGAAFIQDIGPFGVERSGNRESTNQEIHPGVDSLRQIIALDNSQHVETFEPRLFKKFLNQLVKRP